jgi:putative FmdB family regulatory protein
MPIYDFQCTSCGHIAEMMRKMSEASTTTCPNCNKETFVKMLSAPSFQLSGSGWYATDFKDKKPKSTEKTTANNETKTASSDTTTPAASCAPGCACH